MISCFMQSIFTASSSNCRFASVDTLCLSDIPVIRAWTPVCCHVFVYYRLYVALSFCWFAPESRAKKSLKLGIICL